MELSRGEEIKELEEEEKGVVSKRSKNMTITIQGVSEHGLRVLGTKRAWGG